MKKTLKLVYKLQLELIDFFNGSGVLGKIILNTAQEINNMPKYFYIVPWDKYFLNDQINDKMDSMINFELQQKEEKEYCRLGNKVTDLINKLQTIKKSLEQENNVDTAVFELCLNIKKYNDFIKEIETLIARIDAGSKGGRSEKLTPELLERIRKSLTLKLKQTRKYNYGSAVCDTLEELQKENIKLSESIIRHTPGLRKKDILS